MPIVRSFLYGTKNVLHFNRKYERILSPNIIKRMCNGYHACDRKTEILPENGPWNVLFFGTDDFAVESLRSLYSKYRSNVLHRLEVVTGNKGKESAVFKYAKQNGLAINAWPIQSNITNFHIGVVVSFGHLIPSHVIDSFPLGMINVHGSLLPRWRGAAPIIYSLMNGDRETGITVMKIMPKK